MFCIFTNQVVNNGFIQNCLPLLDYFALASVKMCLNIYLSYENFYIRKEKNNILKQKGKILNFYGCQYLFDVGFSLRRNVCIQSIPWKTISVFPFLTHFIMFQKHYT